MTPELSSSIYGNPNNTIAPIALSIVIASLASLLIALVYFTLRSYRALTNFQTDEECSDCTNNQHLSEEQLLSSDDQPENTSADIITMPLNTINSYCDFDLDDTVVKHRLQRVNQEAGDPDGDGKHLDTSQLTAFCKLGNTEPEINLVSGVLEKRSTNSSLYEAHFHDTEARLICNEISASLLDVLPPEIEDEMLEYAFGGRSNDKPCCSVKQSAAPVIDQTSHWNDPGRSNKINMVENPLNTL